jgi:hypothetical protein
MGWRPCETWTNKRLRQKEGSREAMKLGSWGTIFLTDLIAFSLFQHSIIPSFHYSCLKYAEWSAGDSLLSIICRNSDTYNPFLLCHLCALCGAKKYPDISRQYFNFWQPYFKVKKPWQNPGKGLYAY